MHIWGECSAEFGIRLSSINNGVNAVSRVMTGVLADSIGRQNVLILSVIGSVISGFVLWLSVAIGAMKGLWIAFVILRVILTGGRSTQPYNKSITLMNCSLHGTFPSHRLRRLCLVFSPMHWLTDSSIPLEA